MKRLSFALAALAFTAVVASGTANLMAQTTRPTVRPVPELNVNGAGTAVAILAAAAFIATGRRRRSDQV